MAHEAAYAAPQNGQAIRLDPLTEKRLLSYTGEFYGPYRDYFENYVFDFMKENYQLMCLYDALLVKRQQEATRLIRGTVNIPKMQPELYARMAQEAKMLIGGSPVWKVNPPRNAPLEFRKKVEKVEDCINDLFTADLWFWQWYSAKFWASIAPSVIIEERHVEEYAEMPSGKVNYATDRLEFKNTLSFTGPRTRVWFPWEFFFDATQPDVTAPIFTRHLLTDGDVKEKFQSGEWTLTPGKNLSDVRPGNGGLRNYGLELIASVPRKAGTGSDQEPRNLAKHELLCCLGYFEDKNGTRKLMRWWVLNGAAVVRGPEDVTAKRTRINFILCATRQVPGFSFGICPGDSAKQTQRATNQTFNGRHEALLYGLVPPFLVGEGQTFSDDKPVVAPATAIRMSGDVRNVQVLQSRVSPTEADSILGYLDAKGLLATNNNPASLGSFKPGTPPSAMETGGVAEGQNSILGMFMLTEEKFFVKWAQMKYWMMMENCPVQVEYQGRAYDLRDMIIGEPQFDLPQLGEAAGRTSDKMQIQAFVSTWAPVFQIPGISREQFPHLFALIEKHAQALNLTWAEEITEPTSQQGRVEPAGIPDEIEGFLTQLEQQNRLAAQAAVGKPEATPKGATNGKEEKG